MQQCWDADSTERPDGNTLEIIVIICSRWTKWKWIVISDQQSSNSIDFMSKNYYTSKTYLFEGFLEPNKKCNRR
jgi:hypothetical protein